MSWGNTGWDDTDPNTSTSGGNSDFYKYAPRRLYVRQGTTRRVMFLETSPFRFYEHSLYSITKNSRDRCICLTKNKLDDRGCPPCDKEAYAYRICYFSVIDMGQVSWGPSGQVKLEGWTSKKEVLYQFERQALGAKVGGKDRPGMVQEIKRQMQRQGGDITGCVYDLTRSGKMVETIGDKMEFIERIDRPQWINYLNGLGANNPARNVEGKPRPLEIDPFDWMEVMKPHPFEQLQALCGTSAPSGDGARTEGADYGSGNNSGGYSSGGNNNGGYSSTPPGPEDDEIPF